MFIKEVEILNFLCFKHSVFDFGQNPLHTSVILNDTSGSTFATNKSLLIALKCILTTQFADDNDFKKIARNPMGFIKISFCIDVAGKPSNGNNLTAMRIFMRSEKIFFEFNGTKSTLPVAIFPKMLRLNDKFGLFDGSFKFPKENNLLQFFANNLNGHIKKYKTCCELFEYSAKYTYEDKIDIQQHDFNQLQKLNNCATILMDKLVHENKIQCFTTAMNISKMFSLFTGGRYTVQFFVAYDSNEDIEALTIKDLQIHNMVAMVYYFKQEQIWYQSADFLQHLLKIAVRLALARNFKSNMIMFDEMDKNIKAFYVLAKSRLYRMKGFEKQYNKEEFCISYLENVLQCCNDMQIITIFPFGVNRPYDLTGANIIQFDNSTGSHQPRVVTDSIVIATSPTTSSSDRRNAKRFLSDQSSSTVLHSPEVLHSTRRNQNVRSTSSTIPSIVLTASSDSVYIGSAAQRTFEGGSSTFDLTPIQIDGDNDTFSIIDSTPIETDRAIIESTPKDTGRNTYFSRGPDLSALSAVSSLNMTSMQTEYLEVIQEISLDETDLPATDVGTTNYPSD